MGAADREPLGVLLSATGRFRREEVLVALELFDAAMLAEARTAAPEYECAGAYTDGALSGFACFGPTPGSDRTFDLYWIAVAREAQGAGVGSRLLAHVEALLRGRGARLLVIETSSRADYASSRGFYDRRGYAELCRLHDFYEPGDDRVILARRLEPART